MMREPIAARERGLPAQIAARIGRRIIQGELKPGDRLPNELEMLETLQVSRTTLREALTLLSSKGFVEAKQRIGTRVRAPEHWNTLDPAVLAWHGEGDEPALVRELFEMRLVIEPQAARLAAARATPDDIAGIAEALVTMAQEHRDPGAAIEADITFHLRIIQAAHNRFLLPVSPLVRTALSISVPKTFRRQGGLRDALALHGAIVEAIRRGDAAGAEAATRQLLEDTYRRNFG